MKMSQEEIMTVTIEQWERLHRELSRLKQQNICLRKRFTKQVTPSLSRNQSVQILQVHAFDFPIQSPQEMRERKKFKSNMMEWSKRMNRKRLKISIPHLILSKTHQTKQQPIEQQAQPINLFKFGKNQEIEISQKTKQQENLPVSEYKGLKLVQNICLFGPREEKIQLQIENNRRNAPNELLYSSNCQQQKFFIYAAQFYNDEGVPFKKLKQQQTQTYADQIIFRKNVKRQDSSLILFRTEEENPQLQIKNQVLDRVNAVKLLGAFFVQFNDFIFIECQENQENKSSNKSMENRLNPNFQELEAVQTGQESNRQRSTKITKKYGIKAKYCFCIFTYFPFINLMEQLVTSLLDEIKIRRVQKYAMESKIQNVSVKFFISQLNSICSQLSNQIVSIPMQIGIQAALSIGHFKILFNFLENKMDDLLYGGWVFDIMKIFDRDSLYDIFINIMTQESVCFVCENLTLLTHVIFFFISILPNPFQYPHPCISRAMRYEWLESPFVLTIGLNESSKWVQQNALLYEKKIFVDLNGIEVKIKGARKLKQLKSDKLKKIFHNFYKNLEGSSPIPQFFKKKQTIIRPAVREENQLVYTMLKNLQTYYNDQIFAHLPNPQIIDYIRQKSPQRNEHSKVSSLLRQVEKYLKQSRKQKEKDIFVESLVQQQIFYMYISKYYALQ